MGGPFAGMIDRGTWESVLRNLRKPSRTNEESIKLKVYFRDSTLSCRENI